MKTVDDQNDGTLEGIKLSDNLDHLVVKSVFVFEELPKMRQLGEPTMKAYYENLARVFRGDMWFFRDTDVQQYKTIVSDMHQRRRYILMLARLLCFDYVKQSFGRPDLIEFDLSNVVQCYGAAMPASEFISSYSAGPKASDPRERLRTHRQLRYSALQDMRDRYHK